MVEVVCLSLQKHPAYCQGRAFVVFTSKKYQVSHLRSWQHKAARRSDFGSLVQPCALQLCGGFFRTFVKYFVCVIIPEDIGLAGLDIIQSAARIFERVQSMVWNPEHNLVSITKDLYSLCDAVSTSDKSRAVPCLASLALLDCSKLKTLGADKDSILSSIQRYLKKLRSTDSLSIDDGNLRRCCVLVQAFLLHCLNEKRPSNQRAIWNLLPVLQSPLLQTLMRLQQKHEAWGNRLLLFLAVIITAFKREMTPARELNNVDISSREEAVRFIQSHFEAGELPDVPTYALDKHTGGSGGYARFFREGILVPEEKRLLPEVHDRMLQEELEARLSHEKMHGPNSSKSSKIGALLVKRFFPKDLKRKALSPDQEPKKLKRNEPVLPFPVAQNVTSTLKKYVYMKEDVVLKGPYTGPRLQL